MCARGSRVCFKVNIWQGEVIASAGECLRLSHKVSALYCSLRLFYISLCIPPLETGAAEKTFRLWKMRKIFTLKTCLKCLRKQRSFLHNFQFKFFGNLIKIIIGSCEGCLTTGCGLRKETSPDCNADLDDWKAYMLWVNLFSAVLSKAKILEANLQR